MRALQRLLILLGCIFFAGCSTIVCLGDNKGTPNQIFAGTREDLNPHTIYDLPFSLVADTIVLPYTIPRTIYNRHHANDRSPEGESNQK